MSRSRALLATLLALTALTGCGPAAGSSGDEVTVTIGYQSKTINTVNAGTLLRSQGYFEKRLAEAGKASGKTYKVEWKDYDTGAPITAQMLAEKIDIGSMGDYPVLINGSKTREFPNARTEFIATTGYNAIGALNSVVVGTKSDAKSLKDLRGKKISTSFGSAGHGMVVRALADAGLKPSDVKLENHGPSIGSSALEGGGVDALSQFVAWPGLLVFQGKARLLFDGGAVKTPTLHGIVARKAFTKEHPEVTDAFLKAVIDATTYLHESPLAAAQSVADATGLPAEVVYLYNGPNGISTFDPTIKPLQSKALTDDVPFLKSVGVLKNLEVGEFVNDALIRKAYGASYDKDVASTANPAAITGADPLTKQQVSDPAKASELWLKDAAGTQVAADPTSLLRAAKAAGEKVRVAYVPDAATGTRWFADKSTWVREGAAFLPFTTETAAREYAAAHPGTTVLDYRAALATVS